MTNNERAAFVAKIHADSGCTTGPACCDRCIVVWQAAALAEARRVLADAQAYILADVAARGEMPSDRTRELMARMSAALRPEAGEGG